MVPRGKVYFCLVVALLIAGSLAPLAKGDTSNLKLTAAGTADGFSLSTVVDGFGQLSGCCGGPLGNAVNSDGNIMVSSSAAAGGTIYVFKDVDNQVLADKLSSTPFSPFPPAFALAEGSVWAGNGTQLIKLNNNGSINTTYTIPFSVNEGLWTNPLNGNLIGAGASGLVEINVSGAIPVARLINSAGSDGVAVSPDGTTVYTNAVAGYNIVTGAKVAGTFFVPGAPDGMGVITSGNSLNGDIVVNTNSGTIFLIDPSKCTILNPSGCPITLIASGGTRGDYTSADPNGSLLVTQSDELMRLSCGNGCSIGGPPPTPEPASLLLLGSGLAALAGFRRKLLANRS